MTAFWARDGVTGIHGLLMFHYSLLAAIKHHMEKGSIPGDFSRGLSFGRGKDAGNELQQDHARKFGMLYNG